MVADEGIALRIMGQILQAQGKTKLAAATIQASLEILMTTDDQYETEQARAALADIGGTSRPT